MLEIMIKTDDAAIQENPDFEIARILRELANKIERGERPSKIYDSNGNPVCRIVDLSS